MKRILFMTIFIVLVLSLSAIEENRDDQYIGATVGMTSGIGLSYRYWPEEWGYQFLFTPYYDSDSSQLGACFGATAFRTLYEAGITRLFLYGGACYAPQLELNSQEIAYDHDFGIGAGPGLEVVVFDHIAFNLMLGYGYNVFGGGINLVGEAGIYYRF